MAADRSGREQEEPVKVVDRRLFDSEGNLREPDREAPAPEAARLEPGAASRPASAERPRGERPSEVAPPRSTPSEAKPDHEIRGSVAGYPPPESSSSPAGSAIGFTEFVMSMAANAFMALGEIPHPATGAPAVDLEAARELIDILGMLQEKTAGNLSPQEARALEANLYELRMRFVERTKGGAGA